MSRLLTFLICLMLASSTYAQSVVPRNPQANGIEEITVTGDGNSQVPPYVRNLLRLKVLRFENSDVVQIRDIFDLHYLQTLEISNNSNLSGIANLQLPHMGEVRISGNPSLGGVNQLVIPSVENFEISDNSSIQRLTSSQIGFVVNFVVRDNSNLSEISGLIIGDITGSFDLSGNSSLRTLQNIVIQNSSTAIEVSDNLLLGRINAFVARNARDELIFSNNQNLREISDLDVSGASSTIRIRDNPLLTTIGSGTWERFVGNIEISNNPSLNWHVAPTNTLFTPWTSVREANLQNSRVTENVLTYFGRRPGLLERLDVSNNQTLTALPLSLAWSNLQELNLAGTSLRSVPAVISFMHELQLLDLTETCIGAGEYQVFHSAFSSSITSIVPAAADYVQGAHC